MTHLIEFGYPERFVTEQVGHSYASTTAIYTSVSNDFKTKTLQAALERVYATTDAKTGAGGTMITSTIAAMRVESAAGDGRERPVPTTRLVPLLSSEASKSPGRWCTGWSPRPRNG